MSPPAPSADGAPQLGRAERTFTLLGVLLGMLLAALDQTIVATAGPAIQRDLAMPAGLYAWITTSYMLASTVFVPIYGKLSDLHGRKPILLVGIGLFLLGSLLCGLSETPTGLILSRAVQGLGSASLFTSAFAVVADIFPAAVRGRYTGLFGAVWGLSSVVGPLLGGLLTDALSWHWVFFVNLPVGAVAVALVVAKMPRLHRPGARAGIDVAGAIALAVAVVPLLLAISVGEGGAQEGTDGARLASPLTLGLLALSVTGVGAFVLRERRAPDPLLDLRLFANPVFAWGNAAVFVIGAGFFAGIVFIPLFMVNVVGLSATRSGMTLTPLTLGLVFGNVVSGQIVSRVGRYKPLMLGSLGFLVVAFALMGFTLTTASTQAGVTWKMIAVGLGLGPSIPLYTLAIQNAVPPQQLGVATASATFFRQIGATLGVAVMGTVFATTLGAALAARLPLREAYTLATSRVYQVGVGVVLLAAALTALIPELPLRKTNA
jgi:EmrB/QacA subfamily drug resistance transporter